MIVKEIQYYTRAILYYNRIGDKSNRNYFFNKYIKFIKENIKSLSDKELMASHDLLKSIIEGKEIT